MDQPEYGRYIQIGGRTIHFSSLHLLFWAIGLAFVAQVALGGGLSSGGGLLRIGGADGVATWALGSVGPRTAIHPDHWWRSFTAIFLHGGILHLLMNSMALNSLGRMVDQIFGPTRLLLLFLASGLGGTAAIVIWHHLTASGEPAVPTIGASGAICGLLGALLSYMRSRKDAVGEMVGSQLLRWTLIVFAFGLMPGISNTAHAGGFITGYLLVKVLKTSHFDHVNPGREPKLVAWAAGFLSAVTVIAFVISGIGARDRMADFSDVDRIWGELIDAAQGYRRGDSRAGSVALGIIEKTEVRDPEIKEVREQAIDALKNANIGGPFGVARVVALTHTCRRIISRFDPDRFPPQPSGR